MKTELNWKVIMRSLIGIVFLILSFAIDWLFIIPVAILIYLNHRDLMNK